VTQEIGLSGGIDESGRGCVVGPLVVAGVSADAEGVEQLKEIGVRDSKELSSRMRGALYGGILKVCARVYSVQIAPAEIDVVVATGKKYRRLNYLEALYFAKVADQLRANDVTVDAADVSPWRFKDVIAANLNVPCVVKAYHKADRDYPVVSAASIIAKVERDTEVERLRSRHGDFGSGYPSDPQTKIFFRKWLEQGRERPDWTRKTWKSWKTFEQSLLVPF
jgi:ribonuclease HII